MSVLVLIKKRNKKTWDSFGRDSIWLEIKTFMFREVVRILGEHVSKLSTLDEFVKVWQSLSNLLKFVWKLTNVITHTLIDKFPKSDKMKNVITWHTVELRIYWPAPQAGNFEFYNFEKIQMGVKNNQKSEIFP